MKNVRLIIFSALKQNFERISLNLFARPCTLSGAAVAPTPTDLYVYDDVNIVCRNNVHTKFQENR
jgi:hypothetical protein